MPTASGNGRNGKLPVAPGNPFARRVACLRRALVAAVSEEDLQAVARSLVKKARRGDTAAAKLLAALSTGRRIAGVRY